MMYACLYLLSVSSSVYSCAGNKGKQPVI